MLGNISPKPTRMKLNLKKPLIVFDLETTGLDLVKDRIIQMFARTFTSTLARLSHKRW